MKLTDIAWAAGIIEGEGCVIVHGEGKRNRQIRLAVEMCDLDVLKRLQNILGQHSCLRERKPRDLNPNHKIRYILTLSGLALGGWLMTIYTFMGERRRAKILEAIAAWKSTHSKFHYHTPRTIRATWSGQQQVLPIKRWAIPSKGIA